MAFSHISKGKKAVISEKNDQTCLEPLFGGLPSAKNKVTWYLKSRQMEENKKMIFFRLHKHFIFFPSSFLSSFLESVLLNLALAAGP